MNSFHPNHSVYVIREIGTGTVKIGKTRGCAYARMSSLQCGCPYRLEMVAVLGPREHPGEDVLHRRCAKWRIRNDGEWFWASDELFDALGIRRPQGVAA